MIDANEWLTHAADLARETSETALRRSVSASYYAVFHAIASASVDALGAQPGSLRARLIHRGLAHERLRLISAETVKRLPGRELAPFWPTSGFGAGLRLMAGVVTDLQQARHAADYDPDIRMSASTAGGLAEKAASAICALHGAPAEERDLWLTLVLLRPPGRA